MLVYFKATVAGDYEHYRQSTVSGITYGDTLLDAAEKIMKEELKDDEVISLSVYPESDIITDTDYGEITSIVNQVSKIND